MGGSGVMSSEDAMIVRGMTYKDFMERKKKVDEIKSQVKKLEEMKQTFSKDDLFFIHTLIEYFYEEVPQKVFNDFLKDHSYSNEDYVRVMALAKKVAT
jgi:hypothetical protein